MDKIEIVKLLMEEKKDQHIENLEMIKTIHKLALFFITIVLTIISIQYSNINLIENTKLFKFLFYGIFPQVLFFLSIIMALLYLNLIIHSIYIKEIERKINKIMGTKITIWESNISHYFVNSKNGLSFWLSTLIIIAIILSLVFTFIKAFFYYNNYFKILVYFEFFLIILVPILFILELKRIDKYMIGILDK